MFNLFTLVEVAPASLGGMEMERLKNHSNSQYNNLAVIGVNLYYIDSEKS